MKETIIILVLGTATPGGGFPLYGAAFAEMVNAQEPRIRVEPRNTKGSTENVPLLEAGKLDLALVAGEIASAALAKPDTKLRIVAAMYSSPGMFIVRGDSPHRGISDLRGKPVVMGAQASGVTALGRTVLGSLGIEVKPIFLEKAVDGPPMLMDGRAEALWGAGVGWPAFTALAKQGGRFISPTPDEVKRILEKNSALQAVTLPANSYPGQDQPLASVGSWSYVLANQSLSQETAYLLARAVHRAEGSLAARLEQ
ncbi:MAG: TAXI family TRAP transporter solute-binding subunit, partial [Burkholderiales bacterium]